MWVEIMLVLLAVAIVSVIVALLVVKIAKKINGGETVHTSSNSKDLYIVEIDKEEIVEVDKYVKEFMGNQKLLALCRDYACKTKRLKEEILELICLPIKTPSNFSYYKKNIPEKAVFSYHKLNEVSSEYLRLIQSFVSLDLCKLNGGKFLSIVFELKKVGINFNESRMYKEKETICSLAKFFEVLCNQNIIGIEKNKYKYYALIFCIYYTEKWDILYIGNEVIKKHKISYDESLLLSENYMQELARITKELFSSVEKWEMEYCLLSLLTRRDINSNFNYNLKIVEDVFNDYKEKEYLKNLSVYKSNFYNKYSIAQIDNMDGAEFEKFVAELFSSLGYTTKHTKLSGDQGVDVIAEKNGKKIAIQAKHYNQPVGNHAIMEVVAGAKMYNANLCYVVTNNYFTKSAVSLANANNVILWDREKLIEKISEI